MPDIVTVLLSSFNGEKYIAEQIESILNQNNVNVNLIIRDDGSADNTLNIIKAYAADNCNVNWIEGENIGFALSFTELVKYAFKNYSHCQLFAFSDQDDIWMPDKLYAAVNIIGRISSEIPVAYCSNKTIVNNELKTIRNSKKTQIHKISKENSVLQNLGTGCTMVFNRKAVEYYVKYIPKSLKLHDYWMYQLCAFFGAVYYDENSYILYRQHGCNQIGEPDFRLRMKQRLKGHFLQRSTEIRNRTFFKAFHEILSKDDIRILEKVVNYRKSFKNKFELITFFKANYQGNFESKFFQYLKILFGWL